MRREQLIDGALADLDLGGELGELELRVLEGGNRLAEGRPLLRAR